MPHILRVDASTRGERSISRTLTKEFSSSWLENYPQTTTTYRDIGQHPVPALTEAWIAGAFSKAPTLPPDLKEALPLSDELIAELSRSAKIVTEIQGR